MSSFRKRLRRLQQSGILGCPECGGIPDGRLEIKIFTHEEASDKPEGLQRCSRCSRINGGLIRLKLS